MPLLALLVLYLPFVLGFIINNATSLYLCCTCRLFGGNELGVDVALGGLGSLVVRVELGKLCFSSEMHALPKLNA